jgi:hypothetical protein
MGLLNKNTQIFRFRERWKKIFKIGRVKKNQWRDGKKSTLYFMQKFWIT